MSRWEPPTVEQHFTWLRRRWAHRSLSMAAKMTYLADVTDDVDADRQLCEQGACSVAAMDAAGVLMPSLTVVELGCGVGRVATELAAALTDGHYIGVDLSAEYIELCRQRCPEGRFSVTEGTRFPLPDAIADLVIEFTVFTHMPPELVWLWLTDMARILKPAGRCYLQFHNLASMAGWREFTTQAASRRFLTDPGYPRGMEWPQVARLVESAGFQIEQVHSADVDAGGPRSWFVVGRKHGTA